MGNSQTNVKSDKFDLTHNTTDSPLLPVGQIERLQQIAPGRVDWVFQQTQIEAEYRRSHDTKTMWMIFFERIFQMIIGAGLCISAIYVAYLVAIAGYQYAAIAIGSTAPIGIAGAFLLHRRK